MLTNACLVCSSTPVTSSPFACISISTIPKLACYLQAKLTGHKQGLLALHQDSWTVSTQGFRA